MQLLDNDMYRKTSKDEIQKLKSAVLTLSHNIKAAQETQHMSVLVFIMQKSSTSHFGVKRKKL